MTGSAAALAKLERAGALSSTGLVLSSSTSPEQFMALARAVTAAQTMLQWMRGDMIVFAEAMWGAEAYQYLEEMDGSEASKSQWGRVATRFPPGRRFESLSWSHHREVVGLEPDEADRLLRTAVSNGWARNRLADEVRDLKPALVPASGYVVELVCAAAEDVWEAADGRGCVPSETMESLGRALGKVE